MYCWKITCFFVISKECFFICIHNRQQQEEAKNAENALGDKKFLNLLRFKKKRMENLASVSLMCKITNPSQPSYSLAHSLLDWQPFSERSFK